jgi:hypothetical protein
MQSLRTRHYLSSRRQHPTHSLSPLRSAKYHVEDPVGAEYSCVLYFQRFRHAEMTATVRPLYAIPNSALALPGQPFAVRDPSRPKNPVVPTKARVRAKGA